MTFNSSFPVLSTIALILIVLGWLVVAVGSYRLLASEEGSLAELVEVSKDEARWNEYDWAAAGASVGILLLGLFVVAIGESTGVLFSIEQNTAESRNQLSSIAAALHRQSMPSAPTPVASVPAPAPKQAQAPSFGSPGASSAAAPSPTAPPPRTLPGVRQCKHCGQEWEYGDECPDCGIALS